MYAIDEPIIIASTPFPFEVSQEYDFAITDTGTDVSVSINGVHITSAPTTFATGNRVAFQSREQSWTSTSLDYITILSHSSDGPPSITSQPEDQVTQVGSSAQFSVTAAPDPYSALTYQWQVDQVVILGATNSTLTRLPLFD